MWAISYAKFQISIANDSEVIARNLKTVWGVAPTPSAGEGGWLRLIEAYGKCWNWSFCNINYIIRTHTHQILFSYTISTYRYLIFAFLLLSDVTYDLTGVLLGHQRFLLITSDQIEIESRKGHEYAGTSSSWIDWYSTWRLTPLVRSMTWSCVTWPWLRGQPWLRSLPNKFIMRRGLTIGLRWCLIFDSTATLSRSYEPKPNPDLWVIDLTFEVTGWPATLNLGTNHCVS